MNRFTSLLIAFSLTTVLTAGVCRANEGSERERLVDSKAFSAVYAVDDYLTMATAPSALNDSGIFEGFADLCKGSGGELEKTTDGKNGEIFRCAASFTVSATKTSDDGSRAFLIRHGEPQPLNYRTPVVPSYGELSTPPEGKLKTSYSSVELYEYAYALCKKSNGDPAFVIPRRYGKYVRLTRVAPSEAFKYLLASGSGKDSWFAACEGNNKFVLEKEYRYSDTQPDRFVFHTNRGLEGIDFVRSEELPALNSRLEADITDEAQNDLRRLDFLEEMAWEVAYVRTDFVKAVDSEKFIGFYDNTEKSCKLVTIMQKAELFKDLPDKRVFRYKVCDKPPDTRNSSLSPSAGILLASDSRKR